MPSLSCPAHLQPLWLALWVEEVTGAMRHEVRNRLAAIGNSTFYIKRRLEKTTTLLADDPRVGQFLSLIQTDLEACAAALGGRAADAAARRPEPLDVRGVARGFLPLLALPAETTVEPPPEALPPALAEAPELELSMFVLLQAAIEPGGARVLRLRAQPNGQGLLEMDVATAEGPAAAPAGASLGVLRRLAARWNGRVEVAAAERGPRVSMLVPCAPQARAA